MVGFGPSKFFTVAPSRFEEALLYHLLWPFRDEWALANLVSYISLRSAGAALTAFLAALVVGPVIIRKLKGKGIGENIEKTGSEFLREKHQSKAGTPTMGGLIIIVSLLVALGLFANFSNPFVLLAYCAVLGFGFIGFADDYIKLKVKGRRGLRALMKFVMQGSIAISLAYALLYMVTDKMPDGGRDFLIIHPPFFKDVVIDMSLLGGLGFVLLGWLVMVGTSNGVNLSDGLDGLASGCVASAALALAAIAYTAGRQDWCRYLHLSYVPGCGELAVVMAAVSGASLGFLWFNAHPAQVFMGDTGSLPLGGLMGYVAVVARHEISMLIIGGVFVAEVMSVIIQVGVFKMTGRRVFRHAPIHHHFEKKGWHEVTVTVRFWIVGAILAVLGVAAMKVR